MNVWALASYDKGPPNTLGGENTGTGETQIGLNEYLGG